MSIERWIRRIEANPMIFLAGRTRSVCVCTLLACGSWAVGPLSAQTPASQPPARPLIHDDGHYAIGPGDVLAITSPGEPSLTGRFTVETDRTFTYPLIGRVRAGGMTLRKLEATLRQQLIDGGFFTAPQIMVTVDQYISHRIFILGEVRAPGRYSLSGELRLTDALALAGSTLPSAAGEAVIVPTGIQSMIVTPSAAIDHGSSEVTHPNAVRVIRVNLRALQNGAFSENVVLRDGDAIFVPRAESIYLFGHVRKPGAYLLQHDNTTVLQGLALAGGVTDRGATSRIEIVRVVNGECKKMKVDLDATVLPGDTIVVPERFF